MGPLHEHIQQTRRDFLTSAANGGLGLAALATLLTQEGLLGPARADAMLSVELQEIDPASRVNRNHIRAAIAERAAPRDQTTDL